MLHGRGADLPPTSLQQAVGLVHVAEEGPPPTGPEAVRHLAEVQLVLPARLRPARVGEGHRRGVRAQDAVRHHVLELQAEALRRLRLRGVLEVLHADGVPRRRPTSTPMSGPKLGASRTLQISTHVSLCAPSARARRAARKPSSRTHNEGARAGARASARARPIIIARERARTAHARWRARALRAPPTTASCGHVRARACRAHDVLLPRAPLRGVRAHAARAPRARAPAAPSRSLRAPALALAARPPPTRALCLRSDRVRERARAPAHALRARALHARAAWAARTGAGARTPAGRPCDPTPPRNSACPPCGWRLAAAAARLPEGEGRRRGRRRR